MFAGYNIKKKKKHYQHYIQLLSKTLSFILIDWTAGPLLRAAENIAVATTTMASIVQKRKTQCFLKTLPAWGMPNYSCARGRVHYAKCDGLFNLAELVHTERCNISKGNGQPQTS